MVQFIDLPDVVLLLILVKLPVWKILQLARLCHRLYHLKHVCFNTKFKHLHIFGGSTFNKFALEREKEDSFDLNNDDFDLIIQFGKQIPETSYLILNEHPFSDITLSEDWFVESVDQIERLAQVLPKVTHLTVVSFDRMFIFNCYRRLLANWPKLKSLKVFNKFRDNCLISENSLPVINSLVHLEHLQMELEMRVEQNPVTLFAPLLSRGQLKTFICSHTENYEDKLINGRWVNGKADRSYWDGPNEMIQALEHGLETFGLSQYTIDDEVTLATHVTNRALLRKLKYFHGSLDLYKGLDNLVKWDLTNWTALQCVHLQVKLTDALSNTTLKRILAHLAVLTNLTELHLNIFSRKFLDDLVPLETFHNLPRLESVRKFQVFCLLEPHQCLPLLARAFPNASELSLRLWSVINTENYDFDSYIERRDYLKKLCGECKQTIKRAIDKYGHIIASFHWFLEQEQIGLHQDKPGQSYKVVPKVKLFSKEIAGRIRPNFGYIPID